MKMKKQGLYLPEFEHDNCGAGFICSLKGKKSNDIIHKALEILVKLEHRGAVSADGKTGDGAGILIDIPHEFFKEVLPFKLPKPGQYAAGIVFLPKKENQRNYCISVFEENIKKQGLTLLGWRDAPVNRSIPGRIAVETEPFVSQIFIGKEDTGQEDAEFIRKLYIARKTTEHTIITSKLSERNYFYLPSLSTRIIIFKGLLNPQDIKLYYKDLMDPRVVTRLALVHQRFSTNTFPTWDLAQPFRYMCHNGEAGTGQAIERRMNRAALILGPIVADVQVGFLASAGVVGPIQVVVNTQCGKHVGFVAGGLATLPRAQFEGQGIKRGGRRDINRRRLPSRQAGGHHERNQDQDRAIHACVTAAGGRGGPGQRIAAAARSTATSMSTAQPKNNQPENECRKPEAACGPQVCATTPAPATRSPLATITTGNTANATAARAGIAWRPR
jgi:glutamate synthase domain-containing protein 1